VRSTFFVLGNIAETFPEVIEEIYDFGHEVASHGYFHVDFMKLSLTELKETESKNRMMLAKITGEVPISVFPYLRLPIGGWFLRNFGVTYVKTAIKWFLRRGMPTIIYVHPFDVDLNAQKLGGIHFYATRHCGEYTLKAIKNLVETLDCPKVPIRDVLRESMVTEVLRMYSR